MPPGRWMRFLWANRAESTTNPVFLKMTAVVYHIITGYYYYFILIRQSSIVGLNPATTST
jgi:hypothetical protein